MGIWVRRIFFLTLRQSNNDATPARRQRGATPTRRTRRGDNEAMLTGDDDATIFYNIVAPFRHPAHLEGTSINGWHTVNPSLAKGILMKEKKKFN